MSKPLRKITKYLLIIGIVFVVLIVLLLAFTQTRVFKNLLRNMVVNKADQALTAELQLDRIEGNFFTNLSLKEIALVNEGDTILYLPEFRMRYRLLQILKREIHIDSLLIDSPDGSLVQSGDSTWNFTNLVQASTVEMVDSTEPGEPFGFKILINDFYLKDVNIDISALDTTLPHGIRDFCLRFAGNYSQDSMGLDLKQLSFRTEKPDFSLQQLSFSVSSDSTETKLEDLVVLTSENRLDGKGNYYATDDLGSGGILESTPIQFGEFRAAIPSIRIYSNPTLSLNASFIDDSLTVKLNLREGNQSIGTIFGVGNLSVLLDKTKTEKLRYYLNGDIRNLDVAYWLGDPNMDYMINGIINTRGSGITPEAAIVGFTGDFSGCCLLGRPVEVLNLRANYDKGDAETDLKVEGNFGKLTMKANIKDILDLQKYQIDLSGRKLNTAILLMNDSLSSDLNFGLTARGQGFDPENIKSSIQLFASHSTFREIDIDSLFTRMKVIGTTATIDTLFFNNDLTTLNLKGVASMNGESDINFRAELGDLEGLKGLIQAEELNAKGYLLGRVAGKVNSLHGQVEMKLSDIAFNVAFVDSLSATVSAFRTNEDFQGEGIITLNHAVTPEFSIQAAKMEVSFTQDEASIVLDISHSDSLKAHLESQYLMGSVPRVLLPVINIDLRDRRWSGGSENTEIIMDGDNFTIDEFELRAPTASPEVIQTLKVSGAVSLSGEEDLKFGIANIEIQELVKAFKMELSTGGNLTMDLSLEGNAYQPEIRGNIILKEGYVNQFTFNTLAGELDYENERFSWLFSLIPVLADSLTLSGFLPMKLSIAEPGDLLYDQKNMEIRIRAERLPLSVLKAVGQEIEEVQGTIACDLTIGNVIADPVVKGYFSIPDGSIKVPDYGIDYSNFVMNISVDDTRIGLEKMQVKRGDGKMDLTGYVEMDSSIISGIIADMKVQLLANKFFVTRHRDFEIQISGNAELSGDLDNPVYGGKMTVLRSSFYLPALTGKSSTAEGELDAGIPMLVEALKETIFIKDTIETEIKPAHPVEKEPAEIVQNLRGKYKVIIPKNTWIKSPEMKIEISGDLDLVKEGVDFELFGFVDIVRGHYDLYGRRFNIKKGSIVFQGGTEYNPEVILEAEYIFRTAEREKKSLKLFVTGQALTPTMKFTLNEAEITEGDAISYIMFSRSLEELTYGQQEGVANASGGGTGDLAKGLAANILSDQLAKTLGKKLNLDYIELSADDNWQSATFVVGKYLTNDLFMSYMRRIGESQDKDIAPQTITLEYELTKFLFLQLLEGSAKESGIDMILKFEWD